MVYFLRCGSYVKIGTAFNVSDRIKSINTMTPYETELLLEINGGIKKEKQLHRKFHRYRTKGEWFKLCGELKEYLIKNDAKIFSKENEEQLYNKEEQELTIEREKIKRNPKIRYMSVNIGMKPSQWNLLYLIGDRSFERGIQAFIKPFLDNFTEFYGGQPSSAMLLMKKLRESEIYYFDKLYGFPTDNFKL